MFLPPRKLSKKGAEFIARYEGFVPYPYNDAAGHATIGYGHLLHHGPVTDADRKHWGRITREEGLALLRKDAQTAADAIYRLVRPRIMSQSRFDALVSFVYNVGVGAFEKSTLLKRLNSGRARTGAHAEFLKWDKAGGRILVGLQRRRTAEARLFATGEYYDGGIV